MLNHWEATEWLHKKLRDKAINQKDFRLGIEHLLVCDQNGWHPKSNAEMAKRTGILKTEVVRGNRKLEKTGFLRVVKHPGMGRWVTNDHYVLIGHTVFATDNIHRTQMEASVSHDLHLVAPVQDSVSGAVVSDDCANQSLAETESFGSARNNGVGAVAPTENNGDSESGLPEGRPSSTADHITQEVPSISVNGSRPRLAELEDWERRITLRGAQPRDDWLVARDGEQLIRVKDFKAIIAAAKAEGALPRPA